MSAAPLSLADARAALDWYVEMGVDVAIAEEAQDRYAESAARKAAPPASLPPRAEQAERPAAPALRPQPSAAALLATPAEGACAAREAAASAASLEELRAILEAFDGCALKTTANRLVFADGTPGAKLMLIGEAPGREEDLSGLPFVGRSGQLLDRMLAAIGLDRSSAYIANVIPWRPPGNRTPTPQETETCLPFVRRQIELAAPEIVVALGGAAAQSLFRARDGIMKLRGRWLDFDVGGRPVKAMATLHPAYLLRSPAQKALAWRDLKAIRNALAD
ncbi:uracil-DNA glycosylase [Chelatococcus sambhunathii]|uniref:Type-4 uracil-DNA glycosylase n=1 Tax=Chelatococcus sambhunathii TaxID=363953 RepID=A0ABU1DKR2_9HYPH|nr:uracil-DNA glycosylase [Chelatococcus sambhunathii]MDR4308661.1 uracil-DNA glycosylase [Chelatococcus sambhunathii]